MVITKLSELPFSDCSAVGGVQIHELFGDFIQVTGDDFLDLLQRLGAFRGLGLDRRSIGFSPWFPGLTRAPL